MKCAGRLIQPALRIKRDKKRFIIQLERSCVDGELMNVQQITWDKILGKNWIFKMTSKDQQDLRMINLHTKCLKKQQNSSKNQVLWVFFHFNSKSNAVHNTS